MAGERRLQVRFKSVFKQYLYPLKTTYNATIAETAKGNKWFHRTRKDVLNRECTPTEKADVMAYLLSLQP